MGNIYICVYNENCVLFFMKSENFIKIEIADYCANNMQLCVNYGLLISTSVTLIKSVPATLGLIETCDVTM